MVFIWPRFDGVFYIYQEQNSAQEETFYFNFDQSLDLDQFAFIH